MDDKGETTRLVECGKVADYEIDDCAICSEAVLRPISVPDDVKPICTTCNPKFLATAAKIGAKINTHTIPSPGVN